MGNDEKIVTKERRLTEKQYLEKEKLLLHLQKEIQQLEFAIKHPKVANINNDLLRRLNIGLCTTRLIAPYVLTAGLVTGTFIFMGNIPFYPNDELRFYSYVMTEFDSLGNVRYEQQYAPFDYSQDMVYAYSKWELQSDGLYVRNVNAYEIQDQTYEDLVILFRQDDISLEGFFGASASNRKELRPVLSEDELQKEAFLQAVIYRQDKSDYIARKETARENLLISIGYVIVTLMAESVPLHFRKKLSSFYYHANICKIKEKYPQVNEEELKRKLKIKTDNYTRLTR